jgi:hypothetical protein
MGQIVTRLKAYTIHNHHLPISPTKDRSADEALHHLIMANFQSSTPGANAMPSEISTDLSPTEQASIDASSYFNNQVRTQCARIWGAWKTADDTEAYLDTDGMSITEADVLYFIASVENIGTVAKELVRRAEMCAAKLRLFYMTKLREDGWFVKPEGGAETAIRDEAK